ncbi:MAG: UPF0158 family protein [Myxococcaceae bacterium]
MLKRLPIDLDDVCIALETAPDVEMHWFLDADTGATILVSREYDPSDMDGPTRDEIEASPQRYLAIPAANPDEGFRDMREFIAGLADAQLRDSLDIALAGTGPFRRFKNVLGHVPEQRERWFAFKRKRTEARASAWFAAVGVEAAAVKPRR